MKNVRLFLAALVATTTLTALPAYAQSTPPAGEHWAPGEKEKWNGMSDPEREQYKKSHPDFAKNHPDAAKRREERKDHREERKDHRMDERKDHGMDDRRGNDEHKDEHRDHHEEENHPDGQ